MTIVNDNGNEVLRKAARVIRQDEYVLATRVNNVSRTPFEEWKVVNRSLQVELKSNVGTVSNLRNNIITTNGNVEINSSGEYRVFTNAVSAASVEFESGGKGRYIPGYELECGIGVRLPTQTWAGTQKVEWGYFDSDDGMGFGVDSGGVYIFVKRLGTVTSKVYQSAWNVDKMDGTDTNDNPSGKTLDLTVGNIFQIEFVWYGYGPMQFFVNVKDAEDVKGAQQVLVHQETRDATTTISQPNLPVSVNIDNGDQSTAREIFVGGRQVSLYGDARDTFRKNGDYVLNKTAPINVWTPMVSFRRKAGRGNNQTVRLSGVDIISSQNLLYTFVSGHTLTGGTFGNLTDVSPDETVVESNRAATAITGGDFLGGYAFSTASKPNAAEATRLQDLNFEFVNTDIVSLVVKPLSTQATVSAVLDINELW